ncbi:MAG TPA: M48 family metalloprotease [Gaiellaceae bacterium]|nr:M48 family metalloprotease [Gaiellaceae bacterium]
MKPQPLGQPCSEASDDAAGSTLSVFALALLGYAYAIGVFLVLLAVGAGAFLLLPSPAVALWVTIPLALVAVGVFLSLWVRIPAPTGVRISEHEAPELFDCLRELRRDLGAPRIHEVWIDGGFNAAVAQYPRLGIVGSHRNVLLVGLPLMLGLPEDELRAVLAHELGHVSRRHGRIGAWVYRLRVAWERVSLHMEAVGTWSALLVRPFVRWYVPRFDRASLALARAHEHEADDAAARTAGAETAGSALVRSEIGNALLAEHFWPELWKRADREPDPPPLIDLMGHALRESGTDADADRWRTAALDADPVAGSTHPTLRARLAALGLEPEHVRPRPTHVTASAADALLDVERRTALTTALDSIWQEEAASTWREYFDSAREDKARLADLEASGGWQTLPVDELREYAGLVSRLRGLEVARSAWERVLALEPETGEARLALGELAVERGDPSAAELLEEAARLEPLYAPHALSTLAESLAKQGRRAEAADCRRRAEEAQVLVVQAHAERSSLTPSDDVVEHGLPAEAVQAIAAVLDRPEIARAYLARKAPETLADHYPVHVVGYVRRGRALRYERRGARGALEAELFEQLEQVMPGPFWLVDLTEDSSRLHRRLRSIPDGCIVRNGISARPLARVAPVLVGILIVGGIVTRFVDDEPSNPPPAAVTPAPAASNAIYRWASRAEEVCSVNRTHASLRLDDVRRERGQLDLAETWAVLRPFEQQLIESLRTLPRLDHGEYAVGLLERDLRRLDRIADDYAGGRTDAARARLGRFDRDDKTEQAFAAVGVHECAPSAPQAR